MRSYIYISPEPQSILFLKELRKEFSSVNQKSPEITWENFFLNRNTKKEIELIGTTKEKTEEEINSFIFPRTVRLNTNQSTRKLRDKEIATVSLNNIYSGNKIELHSSNDHISILNYQNFFRLFIYSEIDLIDKENSKLYFKEDYEIKTQGNDIIISKGVKGHSTIKRQGINKNHEIISKYLMQWLEKNSIFCVLSLAKISNRELAKNFDLAILNDKSGEILNILQKLDPTIAEIRSLTINEPDIYLRRKGENFLPISLFGDCFNRVLDIILRIINSKNSVCLIDEIENGIHYQNQREFWRSLFKLVMELDIQIFATTHSLEMIKAFADVGLEYPNEGAYFELARHEKTNQIVSIKRDLDVLQYSLKHEGGVGLRGE
nr:AAA family ATPase [Geminocystis sp. NIES-3708]